MPTPPGPACGCKHDLQARCRWRRCPPPGGATGRLGGRCRPAFPHPRLAASAPPSASAPGRLALGHGFPRRRGPGDPLSGLQHALEPDLLQRSGLSWRKLFRTDLSRRRARDGDASLGGVGPAGEAVARRGARQRRRASARALVRSARSYVLTTRAVSSSARRRRTPGSPDPHQGLTGRLDERSRAPAPAGRRAPHCSTPGRRRATPSRRLRGAAGRGRRVHAVRARRAPRAGSAPRLERHLAKAAAARCRVRAALARRANARADRSGQPARPDQAAATLADKR